MAILPVVYGVTNLAGHMLAVVDSLVVAAEHIADPGSIAVSYC